MTKEKNAKLTQVSLDPTRHGKKLIVFRAGSSKEGGSIKETARILGTTESNVRKHIDQCHT